MAEVINLATFNLDTQKIQSSLDALQGRYFDLTKAQKDLKDQSKEVAKEMSNLEKANKLLTEAEGDNTKEIEKNKVELTALLKTQKDLYKSEQDLGIQMSSVRKEITLTTTQVKAYQDAEGKTRSLIDQGTAALEREIKTKNDARAANAALNAVSNQLNPNIAEEAELLKKVNAQIDSNTKFIKANASETTQQAMNIGNYKSALDGVDAALLKFGIDGQQARAVFSGFTSAVNKGSQDISGLAGATTKSTMSLKAFTLALASTGIGLFVLALGSLVTYLTQTQNGIDKLNSVLIPLKAVFSGLVGLAADLGDKLVLAFSNPKKALTDLGNFVKQNLINRFTAFGTILDGIINLDFKKVTNGVLQAGTGVENLTDKITNGVKQAGNFLDVNIKKGSEIAKLQAEINKKQLDYNKNQVSVNDKLDEQLLISKDTSRSFTERGNAAREIIRISEENGKKEEEILQLKLKQLQIEQSIKGQGNLTNEDKQKTIDLLKQIDDAEDRGLNARLEQSRVLSGLKKEQQDADLKAVDASIAKSKEEIDLFIAQQGFKKKSTQEEYDFNNELAKKQLDDLELQYQKGKISKTKYETDKLNITNEALQKNTSIVIENAQLELDAEIEKNQKILENDSFLSKEQLRIKQKALDDEAAAEIEFLDLQKEKKLINQQEYDKESARIDAENKQKKADLALAEKAAADQQALIDLENKSIAEENDFIARATLEKERNKILMAQEIEAAKKNGADVVLIKDKYAKLENDIDFTVVQNKLALISGAFGNISQILGENSKVGKAVGIAQALINTYQGITAELATKTITPFEIGLKIANIATVAKIGFDSVRKITAVKTQTTTTSSEPTFKKPNYATGVIGLRGAGDGTSDNISANLSAGESIINARSTSMFANELSAINQAGGGNGINGASNILNQNNIDQSANNSQMITAIANAVAIGAEAGTSKGSQDGLRSLITDRKVMSDAKF